MADLSIDAVIIGGCGKGKTYISSPLSREIVAACGNFYLLDRKTFSPFILKNAIEPPKPPEDRPFRLYVDYGPLLSQTPRFLAATCIDMGPITPRKRPRVHCISLRRRYRNR